MAKGKAQQQQEQEQQYQTEDDARTLQKHQEITEDSDRHQRATDHLGKTAKAAGDAHKTARKTLEKKTKGRLKKAFGGNKDKAGGTAEGIADSERGPMEQVVGQDD